MTIQTLEFAKASFANLRDQLSHNAQFCQDYFGPLSPAQLQFRPAPGEWSIQECLSHLTLAHQSYQPLLQQIAEQTYRNRGFEWVPFWPQLCGTLLLRSTQPGRSWSVPAPSQYVPSPQADPGVLDKYQQTHSQLLEAVLRSKKLHSPDKLKNKIVSSPLSPLITLSATDVPRIVVAHDTLHLDQAFRVLQSTSFPA